MMSWLNAGALTCSDPEMCAGHHPEWAAVHAGSDLVAEETEAAVAGLARCGSGLLPGPAYVPLYLLSVDG